MKKMEDRVCLPEIDQNYFPADSAGRIMTQKIPVVSVNARIGDVLKLILSKVKNLETINYIYAVNGQNKLKGVISIKELFRQPKRKIISKIMIKKVFAVYPNTAKDKTSFLAVRRNLKAVPVTDKNKRLLGVVSNDDMLNSIHRKSQENILKMAGVHRPKAIIDNIFEISIFKSFKHRFPWLTIGLFGGIVAAKIVGGFEEVLEENIILAAFIPLIVYMSDAVGDQMEAFIIRDLAITPDLKFIKYFLKQIAVIFLIGILSSALLFILNMLIYGDPNIGLILAIALFAAILSSVFTGLIIPYVLNKIKLDPANASGPLATIIQDILSIIIYFSVASAML